MISLITSWFVNLLSHLKLNWKVYAWVSAILLLVGSHYYAYQKGVANEQARILASPVKETVTYPTVPATIKPIVNSNPIIRPKPHIRGVGDADTNRTGPLNIYHTSQDTSQNPGFAFGAFRGGAEPPDTVEFHDKLEIAVADTNLSVEIPFTLLVATRDPISVLGFKLTAPSFKLPIKLVERDHYFIESRPWYETPLEIAAIVLAFLLGYWI